MFVFGNHDAEADLTRQQIVDLDGRDAACLMLSSHQTALDLACYYPCDPGVIQDRVPDNAFCRQTSTLPRVL